MKLNKTREKLVNMYIASLKEGNIPWHKEWVTIPIVNGVTNRAYRGVNKLLLSVIAEKEKYNDNRWYTYYQIKKLGLKLKNAKNKGVPIEFWSIYNYKLKKIFTFKEYENYVKNFPELEENFRVILKTSVVFNGSLVEGLKPIKYKNKNIEPSKVVTKMFNKLKVKYNEYGNDAYYDILNDEIILPKKEQFVDNYSYYATQIHELCHATGHPSRLNRIVKNSNKQDYAKEELVAEISASFLMQEIMPNIEVKHYDNHKCYIKSWIKIFENQPQELFKAISKANEVCDYIEDKCKIKNKDIER